MRGWLYLIRNGDLYKIGITKNFQNRMRQLKPDSIVAKLYTSNFEKIERELHIRYKKFRIPQTEYFRLKDYHLKEIKQFFSKLEYPISLISGIFLKSLLSIVLIFFFLFIFISLYVNDMNIVIHKSLLWMERISFGLSIHSIFVHSGKTLCLRNELKYRLSRLIVFILFTSFFRIFYILIQ
mgnify:CR=1 FL=1